MAITATILPTSTVHNDGTATGEASAHLCFDDSNGDTSYVAFGADGYASCGMSDMPAAVGVDSVKVECSYKFIPGAWTTQQLRLFVIVGGTSYYGSYQNASSTSYATLSTTWTTNPATSAPWTQALVNALSCGVEYSGSAAETVRVSYLAGTPTYTPTPATVEVTRHLASVDLWLKRRPEVFGRFTGNLDLLDISMLGIVDLEHTAGPHATDVGWEDEKWQRRPFALHGTTINMDALAVTAKLKDQRPIMCLVRDLAWSDKASGTMRDGIARFSTPGAVFTHTRASEATFTNPVGDSETVPVDCEAYASGGLQVLVAAGGRAQEVYYVTNNSGERTWNAAQGTFQCEVNLAAVSGATFQSVASAYHDANNVASLTWDGAAGAWKFFLTVGGSAVAASKSATPSTSTWYQIGCRWIGVEAELGATAYTVSVWVDRVKGTDAVAAGVMTEVASPTRGLELGTYTGGFPLNGMIRKIHSYQYCLTDVEMARTI